MSIFEIIMLICFGAAWPFSIYKSIKSKSTKGKSVGFMIILIIGYIFGILNKILVKYDDVIYLYILNALMITIDFIIFLKNKSYENKYTN